MCSKTIAIVAAATLVVGCSKKAEPTQQAASAPEAAPATTISTNDNPMIADGLDQLNKQVQQKQYDAAVGALVSMSQMPMSDKQAAQYRARLRETETALLQKAQAGDPGAEQSAQMLGRMITGR